MFEVEVKARVGDLAKLRRQLEARGCVFGDAMLQHDRVYTPAHIKTHPVPSGTNVLRLREQHGEYVVTLKQPRSNELDCIEVEYKVDAPEPVYEMFGLLGFAEFSRVSKRRTKGTLGDISVCLDSVEGLGDFIELERMVVSGDPVVVQRELFDLLREFGVTEADRVEHGYDILIHQRQQAGA